MCSIGRAMGAEFSVPGVPDLGPGWTRLGFGSHPSVLVFSAGPSNVRNGAGDGSSVSDRLSKLQSPRLPRASQRSDEQPVRIDRSPQTAAVRRDWWSQQASGPGRVLVDGTSVAASGQTTVTMYWWNNADSSYVQASGLCASYGGTLAVLSAGPSGPSGLTQGVSPAARQTCTVAITRPPDQAWGLGRASGYASEQCSFAPTPLAPRPCEDSACLPSLSSVSLHTA